MKDIVNSYAAPTPEIKVVAWCPTLQTLSHVRESPVWWSQLQINIIWTHAHEKGRRGKS
jgi:hypothetical protein